MPERKDVYHSILIVSASEQFVTIVRNSLNGFNTVDIRKNAAAARRCILERYYDLIVINGPLPDETGEDLAIDATDESSGSVLLVVPRDLFDNVLDHMADHGVYVLPKPLPRGRIDKAVRYLTAVQNRMHALERQAAAALEKVEEIKLIDRAKFLLMEHSSMSEDEAHRYIGRQAMDHGISRGKAARRILDEME